MFSSRMAAVLLGSFLLLFSSIASADDGEIVARVGAIPISIYELQREVQKILPLQVSFHGGIDPEKIEEIKAEALEKLVDQSLKVQYALVEELSVANALVEEKIAGVSAKFKTREEFVAALGTEGLTRYRASIYRSLLANEAEKVAVTDKVEVTDADVKAYYDENKARFMRPRQFQASHILIKVDPASNADERKVLTAKAEDLARRAKSGEDFFNLAYYNSDDRTKFVGGKLGVFHEGQTVKEFESAILKMTPGEIVGPVKTMYGFHVIRLDDVQEPKQLSYEEMAAKIRSQLEKIQSDKLKADWLTGLKDHYPVEYPQ